jgi:hypothetical protein
VRNLAATAALFFAFQGSLCTLGLCCGPERIGVETAGAGHAAAPACHESPDSGARAPADRDADGDEQCRSCGLTAEVVSQSAHTPADAAPFLPASFDVRATDPRLHTSVAHGRSPPVQRRSLILLHSSLRL